MLPNILIFKKQKRVMIFNKTENQNTSWVTLRANLYQHIALHWKTIQTRNINARVSKKYLQRVKYAQEHYLSYKPRLERVTADALRLLSVQNHENWWLTVSHFKLMNKIFTIIKKTLLYKSPWKFPLTKSSHTCAISQHSLYFPGAASCNIVAGKCARGAPGAVRAERVEA